MALSNQSTKPSIFLPYLRTILASTAGLEESFVRIVAQPDPDKWSYHTGDVAIAIYLEPIQDQPNAGAGRYGTPVTQYFQVIIRTRYLGDQAGGNERAIFNHTDLEVAVANALHIKTNVIDSDGNPLFIMPPRLIPNNNAPERKVNPVGVIQTILRFQIDYVLEVTL